MSTERTLARADEILRRCECYLQSVCDSFDGPMSPHPGENVCKDLLVNVIEFLYPGRSRPPGLGDALLVDIERCRTSESVVVKSLRAQLAASLEHIEKLKKREIEVARMADGSASYKEQLRRSRNRVWDVIRDLAEWEGYSEEFDTALWVTKFARAMMSA